MNYVKVTVHSFLGGDGAGVEMYNSYLSQIVVSMNIYILIIYARYN